MVSLSRYVIMQVLLAATFIVQQIVQILAHWFLARKSCIFNEEKRQNNSFYHEKQFFTFSPPFFAFPHFNWTMLLYYFWNAEGVGSSVREVWFLQDVDRKISDLILTVGRPQSSWGGWRTLCLLGVFYSIFQFLWNKRLTRIERLSAGFFHRNRTNVFCKTSFGKEKNISLQFL